jgi:hypothetical protein
MDLDSLEEYFIKVKLTSKSLHDELVRIYHLISCELENKEEFEYDDIWLHAEKYFKGLEFKLPQSVKELSLWAKLLSNCMFGYSKDIHQKRSIIYGIFRDTELLYAVEVKDMKIVQARGKLNNKVADEEMAIIMQWKNYSFS